MKPIIDLMRKIVRKYEDKHIDYTEPKYICTSANTRNRYKIDEYKIPEDQPQCPIYNDNRCCGGCDRASFCDHCVNCNCHGFTTAARGGTDKATKMRKCSDYYTHGRLKKDGTFDWDYYKERKGYNW